MLQKNAIIFIYKLASLTAFLSNSCAELTFEATTYAWTGRLSVAKPSAIWLLPVPSIKLKLGACGAETPPPPPTPLEPLAPLGSVLAIFLICNKLNAPAKPAWIAG